MKQGGLWACIVGREAPSPGSRLASRLCKLCALQERLRGLT